MEAVVVKTDQQALVTGSFTPDQVELVKRTIAKGASNDELKMFLYQCNRTGLDPFARQIYCVQRQEKDRETGAWGKKMTTQVSIDGFRLVAQRSNEYAGQTAAQWCGKDGKWTDVWTLNEPPFASRVGVYRKGFVEALFAVARFDSYAQRKADGSLTAMWAKMPDLMIAKCAEALALRKAFPQELSGLYTSDEMAQADTTLPPPAHEAPQNVLHLASPENINDQTGEVMEPKPEPVQVAQGVSSPTFDPRSEALDFGKFKGMTWADIEPGYLQWLSTSATKPGIREKALATIQFQEAISDQRKANDDATPLGMTFDDPILDTSRKTRKTMEAWLSKCSATKHLVELTKRVDAAEKAGELIEADAKSLRDAIDTVGVKINEVKK